MKAEEYTTKDGEKGVAWKPEDGDEMTIDAESVFARENLVIKDGKPLKIVNKGIAVIHNGESKFCPLTNGQAKVVEKVPELKGKTLVFEYYTHKEWGKLLGARVK